MTERPPILDHKTHREPSVFDPKALLREAVAYNTTHSVPKSKGSRA